MLNHQRQKLKVKSKTGLRRGCGARHKRHSCLNIIITSAIAQKRRFRGQCIRVGAFDGGLQDTSCSVLGLGKIPGELTRSEGRPLVLNWGS